MFAIACCVVYSVLHVCLQNTFNCFFSRNICFSFKDSSSKIIKLPYFSIDNTHLMYNAHPKLMYTAVYRACSFFTNLDLFCIDNVRVIYRKIRYFLMNLQVLQMVGDFSAL